MVEVEIRSTSLKASDALIEFIPGQLASTVQILRYSVRDCLLEHLVQMNPDEHRQLVNIS